jgi:metal-responsive CopG/Arc/MetJ family transcriptional regulator
VTQTELVQTNFPKKLLEAFDDLWPGLYGSRSAAIIEAVRRFMPYLEEQKRDELVRKEVAK